VGDGGSVGTLEPLAVHRVLAGDDFDLGRFLPNAPYQFWLFAGLAVASEIVPFVASRFQRLRLPVPGSGCGSPPCVLPL
jgi:hypothetical protein